MQKKVSIILLTLLAIAGCSKKNETVSNPVSSTFDEFIINPIIIDDLTFNLTDDYTIEWSFRVYDAIENFVNLSPEILENKSEIEYAECQIQSIPESHPIYQALGWTKTILIKIKIKDDTTLPLDWEIAGAELFYFLGSGRVPGIMVQTRQERLFSGFINENIDVVMDNSIRGIDEIKPYTFKKQTPQITAGNFRQIFQEKFSIFGGRQLDPWTMSGTWALKFDNNLILNLWLVDKDDTLLMIDLKYDDITKPLQYRNDFNTALCAIISIAEPYLEKHQVEQFATTLEDTKPYLEEYIIKEGIYSVTANYWMPSGNNYYVLLNGNNLYSVTVYFETEE